MLVRGGRHEEDQGGGQRDQRNFGGDDANDYGLVSLYQPTISAGNRMRLTQEERDLALNIKEAVAAAKEVGTVSDFMCAQLALIDGDNTQSAVERAYHLQCFREEYGILDTPGHGRRCLQVLFDLMPGLHLCFADDLSMGQSILVFDNAKFDGKQINCEENVRAWLGATYYKCCILCPDFEAIRKGTVVAVECEGYNWKMDADFKSLKRMWTEIVTVYPATIQKLKFFNNGATMTVVVSMLRPFLPRHLRSKVEVGCQFHTRLDEAYLTPNMDEANMKMLSRMENALARRYENEKTFRL